MEPRILDDTHNRGNDTWDLLGEPLRLVHRFRPEQDKSAETARRVLFQLFTAGGLCQEITGGLADFNGHPLFFLVKRYAIEEVRQLIKEVDHYVETFLQQVYILRLEILPLLARLQKEKNMERR